MLDGGAVVICVHNVVGRPWLVRLSVFMVLRLVIFESAIILGLCCYA